MSDLETCSDCRELRASGDLGEALGCYYCNGTGIRRVRESYICNRCSGPMCPDTQSNRNSPHGLVEAKVTGGYDSPHLTDLVTYTFSLCEKCLRHIFSQFDIPPDLTGMGFCGEEDPYEKDLEGYQHRRWVEAGGPKDKLKEGVCNRTKACQNPATFHNFVHGSWREEIFCDEHRGEDHLNSAWIPINLLTSVPKDPMLWNQADRVTVGEAYLVTVTSPTAPYGFTFLPECVGEAIEIDPKVKGQELGAIWIPSGIETPPEVLELPSKSLSKGTLYYGYWKDLQRITKPEYVFKKPKA